MSNTVNPFDFAAETLAQFLAKTISDGTFADVAEALKVDQPGQEADATDIIVAAGELWSNMVDDFVLAAYPLLRTVATGGGGGGSRLAINPTPTIGGPPTARTYTAILNEAITFGDGGGPPSTLVLTLPDIATASPGDQIGLLLTDGNPSFAITFQQTPADLINDPATGFNTGPPGTPLVIAAGTYASAVWLVWEAVQSAGFPSAATWTYVGDRGGDGGSRLAFNPTPVLGGAPGSFTYAAILDEAITFTDFGSFPPNTFDVTLPDIATASAGQRIGILWSGGNPNWTLSFIPVGTDSIVNPATGATSPPGVPLSIEPGTYSAPVFLVFEAEAAGIVSDPTWQYVGDRVARGRSSRFAKTTDATPEVMQLLKFEENLHTVQLEVWVQSVRDTGTNWRFERVKIDAHRIGGVTTIAAVVHETPVIAGPTIAGTTSTGTGGSLIYDYGVIGNLITVRITANAAENWDHTARIEFSEAGA